MTKTIFVTGVTDVFSAAIAHALADAGHAVYVGVGQGAERSASIDAGADPGARGRGPELRTVPLETIDQRSVSAAVREVDADAGRIDVVIHPTVPVALGPAESFTPYQLSELYDVTVLAAQRVNRAVLPLMRERGEGLLIWAGLLAEARPDPFLAPGRALRAALGQLAQSYAAELAPFGIDVTVVSYGTPGAGEGGPATVTRPADIETAASYAHVMEEAVGRAAEGPGSATADARDVGQVVAGLVDAPKGTRPFHVTVGSPAVPQEPPGVGA